MTDIKVGSVSFRLFPDGVIILLVTLAFFGNLLTGAFSVLKGLFTREWEQFFGGLFMLATAVGLALLQVWLVSRWNQA